MKSFLEEYGFAILAAIVVILLIAMCTPVGNLIKQQILNMVDRFAGSADKKLGSVEAGEYQAIIAGGKLHVYGPSSTNTYSYVVHGVKNGAEDLSETGAAQTAAAMEAGVSLTAGFDAGSNYYVVVTNDGTGETFISNTVKK